MWEFIWEIIKGGAKFGWYLIRVGGLSFLVIVIMGLIITACEDYRYRKEAKERLREELKKEGHMLL